MRVLVTGGAGFIGSHVIDRFISAGYHVAALDNLSTGRRLNVPAGVELHVMDVQSPDARDLIRDRGFDIIAHLAAQVDVRKSVADPLNDLLINVVGTVNLLDAICSLPPKKRPRMVFASTGGALYGDAQQFPTGEEAAVNPDAPYGINKLAVEYYLAYFGRAWGMENVAMRFGNVYGPRQDPHGEAGVIAIFAQRLFDRRPLTVFGTGRQTRDYIYVADVANAFYVAATKPLRPSGLLATRAFNIGTAVETSVNELVQTLSGIAGVRAEVAYAPQRAGEVERSVLDPGKAQRELGWRPDVSLRQGLALTYEWVAGREANQRAVITEG